jgi:ribosomal protein S18 acetylase RimI-like enzyme
MTPHDIELAIEWAAREGWNPGPNDPAIFYATDPHGFFIGELEGEPVGCISGVAYGETFGFIGLYIVRPEFRGRGFGIRLWERAMAYLEGRTIGLDGVVAQQDNYRKSGFRLAYRNVRYEGSGGGEMPDGLVDLRSVPFEQIASLDLRYFGQPRETFLRAWIEQPGALALGVMEAGRLTAYGVVRPCRKGAKIGPLFAEHAADAETIFRGLSAHADSGRLYMDVPEVNAAAVTLAQRFGMRAGFETARMYTGQAPDIPLEGIFGVTTFELG